MSTTLTVLNSGITPAPVYTLPDGLIWTDEFAWSPIAQKLDRGVSGKTIETLATKQGGRPITLSGGASHGWCSRAVAAQLIALAETTPTLTLTRAGYAALTVRFRFDTGPAVEAVPVLAHSSAPDSADQVSLTVKLYEVAT